MSGLSRFVGMLLFRFIYPFLWRVFFFYSENIFFYFTRTKWCSLHWGRNVLLPGSFIGIRTHCQKKVRPSAWKVRTNVIQHISWNKILAQSHANCFEYKFFAAMQYKWMTIKWFWNDWYFRSDSSLFHSFENQKDQFWSFWYEWFVITLLLLMSFC